MRFLQRVSIKKFLMGVIGVLIAVLTVLSVNNVVSSYMHSREVTRVDVANALSDSILEASRFEAKERGVTAMALSSDAPADSSTRQMIQDLRAKGDEAFNKALGLARSLSEKDPSNTVVAVSLKRAGGLHSELEDARKNVDRNLSSGGKTYAPKDWIKLMTSFIEANADLRIAAFESNSSNETLQEALRMNIELKHAIWLVGEYAGRERATIAPFVNAKKPFDPATIERLNTFRAVVDINIKPILRLKDSTGIDPEVLKAVDEMERTFLGKFSETRRSVYGAGSTGNYPISGNEWIERSSEGINSILDVSAAVGKMVDNKISSDLSASRRSMILSIAVLAVILLLCGATFLVIKNKVVSPMNYLSETMANIEKTGDLTLKIEVKAEDESGQMAGTFNKMMAKFHDIIQDIHSSTESLASASEELSASAAHIANGSQAQSSRASQVATASQEMNATIAEVVRNVSGVADAAKEASDVASNGGEIVSQTIESMSGIARTAKESREIISTLGSRSQEIGKIISVIEDIADQTNLLALNAAIEAARAGEQGRGFAVVADEVRKLAEKTMKATKEISEMITAMQDETSMAITSMEAEVQAVEDGVRLAEEAGSSLKEIVNKVNTVTSMVHQITTATEEQSAATDQISGDIESVANVIAETSTSAQQIAKASQEIAELASGLKRTVEMFRVSGSAARAHAHEENGGKIVRLRRAVA